MTALGRSIDDCPHDFKTLAEREMPRLMELLRDRIARPVRLKGLDAKGVGTAAMLARMREVWSGLDPIGDFGGCYVFLSPKQVPFYVGISRKVPLSLSLPPYPILKTNPMEGHVGIVSMGSKRGPERERKGGVRERKFDGEAEQDKDRSDEYACSWPGGGSCSTPANKGFPVLALAT